MFLSAVWTLILTAPIHCRASIAETLMQRHISPDVNWWTGVVWITCGLLWCFYQLFGLSFWRHPFTAEHPLLRHWCRDTFLQMLTDGLEWCGLLVDYCDVFISCLDSHSDGTHSLQSIHWWTSKISPNLFWIMMDCVVSPVSEYLCIKLQCFLH